MALRRYDQSIPFTVEKTPIGGRRLRGAFTRTGVFPYTHKDGSVTREYRPPSEVFKPESLASFIGAPVTDLHPSDFVTPENWSQLAKGHAFEAAQGEGPNASHVMGGVDVNAQDMIDKIDSGEAKEFSGGYFAEYDPTPGVSPEGEPYDGIQRNIFLNHLALGPDNWGRMGPSVSLRSDSNDAIAIPLQGKNDSVTAASMSLKHRIAGKIFDAGSEAHLAAVDAETERLEKEVKDSKAALEQAKAETASIKAKLDAASDPKAQAKRIAERVNLISLARREKAKRATTKEDRAKAWSYLADADAAVATDDDTIVKEVLAMLEPDFDVSGLDHAGLMVALRLAASRSAADEAAEGESDIEPGMGDGTGFNGSADPNKPQGPGYDSKHATRGTFDSEKRLAQDRATGRHDEGEDEFTQARKRQAERNAKRSALPPKRQIER